MLAASLVIANTVAGHATLQAHAETPKFYALVVGNSDYNGDHQITPDQHPPFPPDLRSPCRDSDHHDDVANVVTGLKAAHFDITTACDSTNLGDQFDAFVKKVGAPPPGSVIVIYYSGHGTQYLGRVYAVPVKFRFNEDTLKEQEMERVTFLENNAQNWKRLLTTLPKSDRVDVYILIDACRDDVYSDSNVYDEDTNLTGQDNQYIYWAARGGQGVGDQPMLSVIAGKEFARGGTIATIASRVFHDDKTLAESKSLTEGVPVQGQSFVENEHTPIVTTPALPASDNTRLALGEGSKGLVAGRHESSASRSLASISPGHIVKRPIPRISPPADATELGKTFETYSRHASIEIEDLATHRPGMKFDIFVCQTDNAARDFENMTYALSMAKTLHAEAGDLSLREISVKLLTQAGNAISGYRLHTNIMRYDPPARLAPYNGGRPDPREKALLYKVADQFQAAAFLPAPGVGVGDGNENKPSLDYVSAFLCTGLDRTVSD